MLHLLNLPDLLGRPGNGVGIWDVMCQCWGADGTLRYPATMGPWCRQYVGWMEPIRITESGKYALGTSQINPEAHRIDLAIGEYFLIENRQKLFHDAILPGNGGLLIWHIDENNYTNWMSPPGWPRQDGWPGNGNHYQVALLSPDGRYDKERGRNYGDKYDSWIDGTSLESGPGRQSVIESKRDMYPNTDSYRGGVIQSTGIRIYDISEIGDIMTFRVEIPADGWGTSPAPVEATLPPTATPTVKATEPPSSASTSLSAGETTIFPSQGTAWAEVSTPQPSSSLSMDAQQEPTTSALANPPASQSDFPTTDAPSITTTDEAPFGEALGTDEPDLSQMTSGCIHVKVVVPALSMMLIMIIQ